MDSNQARNKHKPQDSSGEYIILRRVCKNTINMLERKVRRSNDWTRPTTSIFFVRDNIIAHQYQLSEVQFELCRRHARCSVKEEEEARELTWAAGTYAQRQRRRASSEGIWAKLVRVTKVGKAVHVGLVYTYSSVSWKSAEAGSES